MNRREFLIKNGWVLAGLGLSSAVPVADRYDDPAFGCKIAFLSDVHLQDLYGTLSDNPYKGVLNPKTGNHTLLRTMASQLHSTRIFNENYFAFIAAMDDLAARGVKLVVLPGDFSDDGQRLHVRGMRRLLEKYETAYDMQFFITMGNHDPVSPFLKESGKKDFLGEGGKPQPIYSKKGIYSQNATGDLPVVLTRDIAKMGYKGIFKELHCFGLLPQKEYKYWSTPFSKYTVDSYAYEKALKTASLNHRNYEVIPGFTIPDVSYVVEPVEGLWLLALDANVYIPKNKEGSPTDPDNYKGSSIGYNEVLSNKKHLIGWAKKVVSEAKKYHKTLITFSHFPMIDFNDGASPILKNLLGEKKWQLARVPDDAVAEIFAEAGIQVHLAGHIHINDTGIYTAKNGNRLVNIQIPSLAAYLPGYKLLTVHPRNRVEVETIIVNDVPRFNELFPLYEAEYYELEKQQIANIWNKEILQSKNYRELTLWHLRELVRLRYINDWPEPIKGFLLNASGNQLWENSGLPSMKFPLEWKGSDLILDFYRLRNADKLAEQDIPKERLKQYKYLITAYASLHKEDKLSVQLKAFFSCLNDFLNGAPANHFMIDLNMMKLQQVKEV